MPAILPLGTPLVDEPQIRLVDQGARIEAGAWRLFACLGARHPAQVGVDERHQLVERAFASTAVRHEQLGDVPRHDGARVHPSAV